MRKTIMSTEIEINERTKVPVSLLIILIFAVIWFIRLEGKVDGAIKVAEIQDKRMDGVDAGREDIVKVVQSVDQRLARIEGKLGVRSDR